MPRRATSPSNTGDIIEAKKDAYRADLPPPDPDWPVDVRLLASYLHAHLFEVGLTVGQAKRECGAYDHNICGRFDHYVGAGPQDYLLTHRFALAKRLLRHDELTVTQIAFAVGYGSPSGFSTTFGRWEGSTPTEFREHRERCEETVEER